MGPIVGFVIQIIIKGRTPLMIKTAISKPYVRNHFLARWLMVESTCALITALSKLLTVSKIARPTIISKIETISIIEIKPVICRFF